MSDRNIRPGLFDVGVRDDKTSLGATAGEDTSPSVPPGDNPRGGRSLDRKVGTLTREWIPSHHRPDMPVYVEVHLNAPFSARNFYIYATSGTSTPPRSARFSSIWGAFSETHNHW